MLPIKRHVTYKNHKHSPNSHHHQHRSNTCAVASAVCPYANRLCLSDAILSSFIVRRSSTNRTVCVSTSNCRAIRSVCLQHARGLDPRPRRLCDHSWRRCCCCCCCCCRFRDNGCPRQDWQATGLWQLQLLRLLRYWRLFCCWAFSCLGLCGSGRRRRCCCCCCCGVDRGTVDVKQVTGCCCRLLYICRQRTQTHTMVVRKTSMYQDNATKHEFRNHISARTPIHNAKSVEICSPNHDLFVCAAAGKEFAVW